MTRWRVLVTRHLYAEALDLLRPHVDVVYHDSRDGLTPDEMAAAVADVDAVICQLTDPIDAAVLDAAGERLQVIANVAVGYDNIDVAAATARGITVTNTPGVLTESTADLAFALLLATARRLTEAERFLREGRWRQWEIDLLSGLDVHEKTLGILGMGRIGRAMARRARGFAMRVLYRSRTRLNVDDEQSLGLEWCAGDDLLREADFVSLHVPLTDATQHLIGEPELRSMKPSAILINTARGAILDEPALITALETRQIAGAGLDVFASEPTLDERLLALDNVVLLPHIASSSTATRTKMCCMAAQNVLACATGHPPPHPIQQ